MEPAELQKQPQPPGYEQKVNEMQKMLPRLEQRIAKASIEKENEQEMHKLKLLQRVLCGQTAADDSFTIEELDIYADILGNDLELPTTRTEIVQPTAAFAVNVTDDKCEAAHLEAKENVDDSNAKNQHNLETTACNEKLNRKNNGNDIGEFQKLCDNKKLESFEKGSNITKDNSTKCVDLEKAEDICETARESPKKISEISEKEITSSVGDNKTLVKESSCGNESEIATKKDEATEKEIKGFERGDSITKSSVNAKRDQRSEAFTKESIIVENYHQILFENCPRTLETLEEQSKEPRIENSATIDSSSSEKKNKTSSSDNKNEISSFERESKCLSSEKTSESLNCSKESESSSLLKENLNSEKKSESSRLENRSKSSNSEKESESSIKTIGISGNHSEKRNEYTTENTQSVNVNMKTNTKVLCEETVTQLDSSERNTISSKKGNSALAFETTENDDTSLRQPEDKQPALAREFPSEAEDTEEIEYEEVELIKIPEDTAEDEMILPDSADEAEYSANSSEGEVEQGEDGEVEELESQKCKENIKTVVAEAEENVSKSCTTSENDSNELEEVTQDTSSTRNMEDSQERIENYKADSSAEEEAVTQHDENEESNNTSTDSPLPVEFAIQMDNQIETPSELEETTHTDDPLSQVDSVLDNVIEAINKQVDEASAGSSVNTLGTSQSESCVNGTAKENTAQMDDDDDVEIIETRNSPICLDTDDEDEKLVNVMPVADKTLIRPKTVTVALQKNVMRTQRHHIQNTNARTIPAKTVKSIKSITETINLLDSSDEEGAKSNKLPQTSRRSRRCAMPTVTKTLMKMPTATVGRKRTLLPVNQEAKSPKPKQGLIGGTLSSNCRALLSNSDSTSAATTSTQKAVTHFKPTPQSNFLNAVNLLPASATSGDNPLAFSAKLLDRNIIIPNAFYANRRTSVKDKKDDAAEQSTSSSAPVEKPSTTTTQQNLSAQHTVGPAYREWLNEFINNFADPQQIASHTCLVLLQSALKYKPFARIKELRLALNTKAYSSNCTTDPQLARELNNNFYLGDCRLSTEALRFCSDACTQIGKNVTLMTDAHTGRVTMRTNTYDELLTKYGAGNANGGGIGLEGQRKRYKTDEEYMPAKYYEKKVEESTINQGERRKSLRQHRTRCYDETYLYEQETEEEKPPSVEPKAGPSKRWQDAQMMALVQRKAEEKRLEAKRQRQKQVKSFESAYLAMFASTMRGKNIKTSVIATNKDTQATTSANAHIVIDDDDEDSLEDGEPRSHRIYKVVPTRLLAAPKRLTPTTDCPNATDEDTPKTKRGRPRKQELGNGKMEAKSNECELITCDSASGDSTSIDDELLFAPDQTIPKNTNVNWHALNDRCRICNKNVPRIVLHYVSMHPDAEVYSSRLPRATLAHLRKQGGQILELRPYMNGQEQYAADCVFCNKQCCFKIPYWYQHLSMHTGEYAYRCSGCHIRKATRSSMVAHINQPCRKRGKLLEDYVYRTRTNTIEMRICTLCNFMQLHRRNILKHLRTQHSLVDNLAKHVGNVILLRMPQTEITDTPVRGEHVDLNSGEDENSSNQVAMTFNYDNFENAAQPGMWDAGDPTDDLSFMICGMLDVQLGNMEQ